MERPGLSETATTDPARAASRCPAGGARSLSIGAALGPAGRSGAG